MSDSEGPVDGRAARWAGQRAKRREEIVSAALTAVAEYGSDVSTEQIARCAGIARPQLYRHFDDAADLYDAIASGAAELLVTAMSSVLTRPSGTARGVITRIVDTFVAWMAENSALYDFVVTRSVSQRSAGGDVAADVRGAISGMVRDVLAGYLAALGQDTRVADPLGYGIVGMVEATTLRWLAVPDEQTRDELVGQLSAWLWGLLDSVLRSVGVVLDPEQPLPELPA